MMDSGWNNPWKLTAIGMALVIVTALATGLVVAYWPSSQGKQLTVTSVDNTRSTASSTSSKAAGSHPTTASAPSARTSSASPPQPVVDACNQYASTPPSLRDKTIEAVKDAAIGAVAGAVVGAAGGAIADGGKGAGKGAAIGGLVGAGGGTLYGLNENRKHDQAYRDAYATCTRAKGYTS